MGRWLERYERGLRSQVWMEMTGEGADLRADERSFADALSVAHATMRRARANVERLVELLPSIGYEFAAQPFVPAPPTAAAELDELEARIGLLPLALRVWFEEVGQVNLVGAHPGWSFDYPDPLVVEASVEYALAEFGERGSAFELAIAPDHLHKADVSGGMPYALTIPTPGADGLLLWEPQQTTFVNYLRLTFAAGGLPGWRRGAGEVQDWALPPTPMPPELEEVARRLAPL
jgi:hypothetical protein